MVDKEPLRDLRVLKGAWRLKIVSMSTSLRRNRGLGVERGEHRSVLAALQ